MWERVSSRKRECSRIVRESFSIQESEKWAFVIGISELYQKTSMADYCVIINGER
jgi:hypothetical protein